MVERYSWRELSQAYRNETHTSRLAHLESFPQLPLPRKERKNHGIPIWMYLDEADTLLRLPSPRFVTLARKYVGDNARVRCFSIAQSAPMNRRYLAITHPGLFPGWRRRRAQAGRWLLGLRCGRTCVTLDRGEAIARIGAVSQDFRSSDGARRTDLERSSAERPRARPAAAAPTPSCLSHSRTDAASRDCEPEPTDGKSVRLPAAKVARAGGPPDFVAAT